MRILIVNVYYSPNSFGGATIVAERTAQELSALGHDVAVVCAAPPGELQAGELYRYEANGIPVIAVGLDPGAEYSNETFVGPFTRVVETWSPDVVHFHAVQTLGVDAVQAAMRLGAATVVTLHDAWWLCERQFMVRSTGSWCGQEGVDPGVCASCVGDPLSHERRQQRSLSILNSAARVLVPSDYSRALMVNSGIDADRIRVNPNGVLPPAEGFERPEYSGPVRFGFVGGVGPLKGSQVVVDALNMVVTDNYVLRVVDNTQNLGFSGANRSYWAVPGRVEMVGAYTQSQLDEFFGSIDVLLFPSQAPESFGLTVREAMSRGVWPVATDLGGVSEAIVSGENGTLFPLDGGAADLAVRLAELLAQPAVFQHRASTDFVTFRGQALELVKFYTEACTAVEEGEG